MDRLEFKARVNDILKDIRFEKTRTFWIRPGKVISEKVVFQKSLYSNRYYFRPSYIIVGLPLEKGFDGHVLLNPNLSDEEYKKLSVLCDLEHQVDDAERIGQLEELLTKALRNTQMDDIESLRKYTTWLDVPLLGIVQNYFKDLKL